MIAVGAIVGVVLSAALVALAFATQSLWPIPPGAYVVARVLGIHEGSAVWGEGVVNAIVFWIAATTFLVLYRWGLAPDD
ncbi:MAG TPA: hypothetical protein VMU26_29130 [Candidatus Polarisedimenticolia bacterium]|nr:hypothetical protein [Candidatus Polarisedimenticolia bacterium]